MAGSFDMLLVKGKNQDEMEWLIATYLIELGYRVMATRKQSLPSTPLDFNTNCVVFISPQGETEWLSVVAWPSELGIALEDWYTNNPLGAWLSKHCSCVVFPWAYRGQLAGYSLFHDGQLAEANSIGEASEMPSVVVKTSGQNLIAISLQDSSFEYMRLMDGEDNDVDVGTALLVSRYKVPIHLTDIMDLVDGDGGLIYNGGAFDVAELLGWSAIVYGAEKGTAPVVKSERSQAPEGS